MPRSRRMTSVPALAARWPVVELAEHGQRRRLLRVKLDDAGAGQPIEDAELALAQALVGRPRMDVSQLPGDRLGGLARAPERRVEHHLRPLLECREPRPECVRLFVPKVAQRHVDVAHVEVDPRHARRVRSLSGDVAGALPVTDDPQAFGPVLERGCCHRGSKRGRGDGCAARGLARVERRPRTIPSSFPKAKT